jgi:TonB family protein
VTTPPNPQQLLRRPKKPAGKSANAGVIVASAVGGLLVVSAIVGYVVFGHGKSAASTATQVAATTQVAAVPAVQNYAPSFGSVSKHAGAKPLAPKPAPGSSPTPVPTATPNATPTPQATTQATTAAEIAKAKHQAALHLAALRREQAAQNAAGSGLSTASLSGASNSTFAQPTSQPVPTQSPTPTPATATPDAQPTPVYAPRVVVDARFVDRVSPAYPDIAREQGAQGTAIVLATVGPKGNVISVQVDQSTGNKLLDQAALSAARSSRFEPPEIDGRPATETYRIVYTFDLNS